jgi:hypothetical protein
MELVQGSGLAVYLSTGILISGQYPANSLKKIDPFPDRSIMLTRIRGKPSRTWDH